MTHRLAKCLDLHVNVEPDQQVTARGIQRYFRHSVRFREMLEYQGHKCAICEAPCATDRELAVDHCHNTGKIRGLLCMRCNTALGAFKDDPLLLERAYIYLITSR